MNAKAPKHRIPLPSFSLNHPELDSQLLNLLYVGVSLNSLLSRFKGAAPVLKVPMVCSFWGKPAMQTAACPTLNRWFLARVACSSLSPTSHFGAF